MIAEFLFLLSGIAYLIIKGIADQAKNHIEESKRQCKGYNLPRQHELEILVWDDPDYVSQIVGHPIGAREDQVKAAIMEVAEKENWRYYTIRDDNIAIRVRPPP